MKIEVLTQKVICSNEDSIHNYFAWPTVARLHDGRLAMVASGFRTLHICPFGKVIMAYSEDEGQTWSRPSVLQDTPLDDRDSGIVAFGENKVIVTSFNNTPQEQRTWAAAEGKEDYLSYFNGYLDIVEKKCDWKKYHGSTYRISSDNGTTFGPIRKIPVSCPHGPAVMLDGSLLYVGHRFEHGSYKINCYQMFQDGSYQFLSEIEDIDGELLSCEPHTVVLPDGKIIVHIRVQRTGPQDVTIYQCESYDDGKSFTRPHRILSGKGGSPAHLIYNEGMLISVYGYRREPYGIRAMFSRDQGETWDEDNIIVEDGKNYDLGYPASVVLKDGSILTVYYEASYEGEAFSHEGMTSSVIKQVVWKYENNKE